MRIYPYAYIVPYCLSLTTITHLYQAKVVRQYEPGKGRYLNHRKTTVTVRLLVKKRVFGGKVNCYQWGKPREEKKKRTEKPTSGFRTVAFVLRRRTIARNTHSSWRKCERWFEWNFPAEDKPNENCNNSVICIAEPQWNRAELVKLWVSFSARLRLIIPT